MHQHQRPIKSVEHGDRLIRYVEVTLDDIAAANRLAHGTLGRTLDELPSQTRILNTLFDYPEDIRKVIYKTNAIESLNSVIRKAIKKRKLFPTDDSAKKVIYLAIQDASKRWTMPIHNWKPALNRFMIEFEDRLVDYI
jgi:transposase-like protein